MSAFPNFFRCSVTAPGRAVAERDSAGAETASREVKKENRPALRMSERPNGSEFAQGTILSERAAPAVCDEDLARALSGRPQYTKKL